MLARRSGRTFPGVQAGSLCQEEAFGLVRWCGSIDTRFVVSKRTMIFFRKSYCIARYHLGLLWSCSFSNTGWTQCLNPRQRRAWSWKFSSVSPPPPNEPIPNRKKEDCSALFPKLDWQSTIFFNDTTVLSNGHTDVLAPLGRSILVLPAAASVHIAATAPTTIYVESGEASTIPVPLVPQEEDLSHPLHSKPGLASIVSQESAHPSVPNRKTIELWFHGRSQKRVGAGAVVTIQPDDTTYHVRHVLHGTRTCIDLRIISNNQAQYAAIVLALQVMMDYLRRQPPGTRLDSLVIHGDLELILKQLDGACKCKSQVVMPYYLKSLEMFRQCIDAYMTPLAIEKIRVEVHHDIQVLHIPRKHNSIAQGT
jgi:hypothetical protein